MFVCFKIKSGQ